MGRFNFQECQRLIELFLELKCMGMWPILPDSAGCAYMDFFAVSPRSGTRVREGRERCHPLAPIEGYVRHRRAPQTKRAREQTPCQALVHTVKDIGRLFILRVLRHAPDIQGTASSSAPGIPRFSRRFSGVRTGDLGGVVRYGYSDFNGARNPTYIYFLADANLLVRLIR